MTDFEVHDRRGGAGPSANAVYSDTLRKAGVRVQHVKQEDQDSARKLPFGDPRREHAALYEHMSSLKMARGGQQMMRRTASEQGGRGVSAQMATARPRDPMWYWKQNNLPINFTEPGELERLREFCNTPDAPVMMADQTTKALGDIVPGDQVMGWTYLQAWNGGMRRKYEPATVLAVSTRKAPNVVEIQMASGAVIRCTDDHKWHNPHWTKPQSQFGVYPIDYSAQVKLQTTEYAPASVGTELLAPTNIQTIINPGNLFSTAFSGEMTTSDAIIDKVISITPIGEADVVSMQTTTGNYIVWGYCSKNCRLLYATHPIVSACIDVYSKLPMQGLHFECFTGETFVWTDQGIEPINMLTGQTHRVLTTGGNWVQGKFEAYGQREIYEVRLQRNGRKKTLWTTEGHRWFVYRGQDKERKREVVTTALEPGMRLVSTYARNVIGKTAPSPFGIAHGFTYGDGTMATWGGGAVVDLHGEKDAALLPYFALCTQKAYPRPEHTASTPVKVSHLPAFFKQRPDPDEGVAYLYGWLAGYFAADGTVSKKGECFLDSADRDSIEFADLVCQRLGIKTYEPYEYVVAKTTTPSGGEYRDRQIYRLPIDPASLTEAFFVIPEHRARWTGQDRPRVGEWTVLSVEKTDRVEQVYCATVPGTEAFVIEGNILTGNCKDPQLVDFYSELFMDQLDYEEHLLKLGRQYWLSGESWSLGGWNETLGIWEEEQLLNPNDIEVESNLFFKEPRYLMKLPEGLRNLLQTRQPNWQYQQLVQQFPELVAYAQEGAMMPVSNIVLQQMRFEADDFSNRGIPILLRAMRTLIQEEMLNSALDSIADRLYTPLILAKLGAKAQDLGTSVPWVPSQDDLEDFLAGFDMAMAADFRVLAHHWALDVAPVFGRENVPNLNDDFDRIVERILMVFGLSQTMLTGASAGETYAADALNRDVVTQLLSHYQRMQSRFVDSRARIVAEAQGHFDYEVRNGMRYLITEEVYEYDEETGQGKIIEIPKLLVPELKYKVLNLSDEEQERQFVETLAEAGVPVPYRARLHSAGIDFEEALEQRSQEEVALAVAEQETRKKKYLALKRAGLPIADDLKKDFDPKAIAPGQQATMPGMDQATPTLGGQLDLPGIAPTPDELAAVQEGEQQGIDPATGQPMDGDPNAGQDVNPDGTPQNVPEESNEERADMPKAAKLTKEAVRHNAAFDRFGRRAVVEATNQHYVPPDNSKEVNDDGQPLPENFQPVGRFGAPMTYGMASKVVVPEQLRLSHLELVEEDTDDDVA